MMRTKKKISAVINLEYRMYSLVLYSLSGIQKGIQAGHSKDEFERVYGKLKSYKKWLTCDKTVILLNGGTSNVTGKNFYNKNNELGTMELNYITLQKMGVNCMPFYEPDLNNATTSISFLVDERVWNKIKYPEFDQKPEQYEYSEDIYIKSLGGLQNYELRNFLKNFRLA